MNDSTQSSFSQVTPRILSAVIALVAGTTLTHAETAYEALQTVGDKLGEESLERVVSVQGNNTGWTVSLLDPNSTAQLQEVRVRKSRIVSKTAEPSAGRLLTPIDLDHLNLDSDAAWKLATRHLQKTVPASRVDYTLATDVNRSMPVWVLKLRNPAAKEASILQIAANDGSILTENASVPPVAAAADEETALEEPAHTLAVAQDTQRQNGLEPTSAGVEPIGEPQADVAIEETREVRPSDPIAKANEQSNASPDGFRARRTTRTNIRSSSPPAVVRKVAGKVERKVRFVRRIIPF